MEPLTNPMAPKLISRKEAKNQGLKRYFTGKECKHGHVSERWVTGQCVECRVQYYLDNAAKIKAVSKARYHADPQKVGAVNRAWALKNKARTAEIKQEWAARNPGYVKAKMAADPVYAARVRARDRARAGTKEAKARKAASDKRYRQEHRAKSNAHGAKKRAAKLQRTPGWLTEQDFIEIEMYYFLARRMTEIFKTPFHVDHKAPLQGENVSGLHHPKNLQVLARSANSSKHNKFEVGYWGNG